MKQNILPVSQHFCLFLIESCFHVQMWSEKQSSNRHNEIIPMSAPCCCGLVLKAKAGTVTALLALAGHCWPWLAPQDFPHLAWFYSELLTFLWERNSHLEERKGFGLHAGKRVSVVKELRSSPELVLCHPHHIAAIPTTLPPSPRMSLHGDSSCGPCGFRGPQVPPECAPEDSDQWTGCCNGKI